MKKTLQIISILLICLWITPAFALDASEATMQALRGKVKADKKTLVEENLKLTDTEGKAFWPIYESFQIDITKINDRRYTLIKDYAKEYKARSLSDKKAKEIISNYLVIEEDLLKLTKAYLDKLSAVLQTKR